MAEDSLDGYQIVDESGTPASREYGWKVGFGLQAADGLTPSDYAYEVARKNIEGEYSYDQAEQELKEYHSENPSDDRTAEADLVSQRISRVLQTQGFVLAPTQLAGIHRALFTGVFPEEWAGNYRTENLTKAERVLDGQSVLYSDYRLIPETLAYDFEQERLRQPSYRRADDRQVVESVTRFVSGVWQIHPFREGNTRSTTVFAIKYLNSLGFTVDDEPFAQHAQEVRDALALANGPRGKASDTELIRLFAQAVLPDGKKS